MIGVYYQNMMHRFQNFFCTKINSSFSPIFHKLFEARLWMTQSGNEMIIGEGDGGSIKFILLFLPFAVCLKLFMIKIKTGAGAVP